MSSAGKLLGYLLPDGVIEFGKNPVRQGVLYSHQVFSGPDCIELFPNKDVFIGRDPHWFVLSSKKPFLLIRKSRHIEASIRI